MALLFALALIFKASSIVQGDVTDQSCQPVGTKSITISWQSSLPVNTSLVTYYVYFCKLPMAIYNCLNTSVNYHLGCSLNVTDGSSIHSCDIGQALKLNFPTDSSFNYFIKTDYGHSVQDSTIMKCPVSYEMKCSKPTGLKLIATGRGSLNLSWSPPTDMGTYGPLLCYFIQYYMEQTPHKKFQVTFSDIGKYYYQLKSLQTFKTYYVNLQCAVICHQKKSDVAGPVVATTVEEEPKDSIIFVRVSETVINSSTRNVTVFFEIPNKENWNGNIKKIRVFCYKNNLCTNNITLINLPFARNQLEYNVTIPFLKSDEVYVINADYCNSVGCSPPSQNQTISFQSGQPLELTAAKASHKSEMTTEKLIGIIVGCLIVLLGLLGIVIWLIRHHRNGNPPHSLDSIDPPPPVVSNNDSGEDPEDPVYAKVNDPVSRTSRATLNPETTDFQSASIRSLNSFGGITDQSTLRDGGDSALREEPEVIFSMTDSTNQENVKLLQRPGSKTEQ